MIKYLIAFSLTLMIAVHVHAQGTGDVRDSVVVENAVPAKAVAAADPLIKFDVNGDNVVNIIDVVDIVRFTRGNARSAFQKSKADVNGDGKVNLDDASSLSDLVTGGELPTSSSPTFRGDTVADPTGPTP